MSEESEMQTEQEAAQETSTPEISDEDLLKHVEYEKRFFGTMANMATAALKAQAVDDSATVTRLLHQIRAAARLKAADQALLAFSMPSQEETLAALNAVAQNEEPGYRQFREACVQAASFAAPGSDLMAYIDSLIFLLDYDFVRIAQGAERD